jgi:uncharacterized membrane protein YfcA
VQVSCPELLFVSAALFAGSLVAGVTGFGYALVSTPLMVLALPATIAVPLQGLATMVVTIWMGWRLRSWVQVRRVLPLGIAGIVGVPIGTWLLLVLEIQTLKIIIGVISMLGALASMAGWRRPIVESWRTRSGIGLLAGVMSGSTWMGGPPLVLFLSNQGTEKQAFRANLAACFALWTFFGLVSQIWGGLITSEVLRYTVVMVPVALLGRYAGMSLAPRIDEERFRTLSLLVLIGTSLVAVASGAGLI